VTSLLFSSTFTCPSTMPLGSFRKVLNHASLDLPDSSAKRN
jgi:hypothetical protein